MFKDGCRRVSSQNFNPFYSYIEKLDRTIKEESQGQFNYSLENMKHSS